MNLIKTIKNPKAVFYLATIVCCLISFILLMASRGSYLDFNIFFQGNDMFMDFFNHITYSENLSQTYFLTMHACFPPLAYLFYFMLNRILPKGSTVIFQSAQTAPYAILVYVIYVVLLSVLLFYCIRKVLHKNSIEECLLLSVIIFLSNVFIFGVVERGNSVLIVLVLLTFAILFRDSKNKILKETSLILIAIAVGFKIYPAVFILLYVSEKRYTESFRLIIYSFIFFFVPFLFVGGFLGFFKFLTNQIGVQGESYYSFASIKALFNLIGRLTTNSAASYKTLSSIILVLFLLCSSLIVVLTKTGWKNFMLLCGIMVITPAWSGDYTVIYMVLPLLYFIKEVTNKQNYNITDYIYSALFALMFLFFVWDNNIAAKLGSNMAAVLRYSAIYLMLILILAEGVIDIVKQIKDVKKQDISLHIKQ